MKTYSFKPNALPFDDSWDVIVAGGGPSGCTAAAAAAREGARTLLIESTGSLGGSGTNALVPAWCPFSDKDKIIYRGLARRVFTEAKKGCPHVSSDALDWVPINAEWLKRVYDDLVLGSGAKLLFHTQLSSVETNEDGEVITLIVSNKAGLTALKAKVYIDCTGDADLTAWAGGGFHKGDEKGKTQPSTHCFVLSNVDMYAYQNGPSLFWSNEASPIHAILASGRYPEIPDNHICNNITGPGAVGFNAGHIWDVDSTDPYSVSAALVQGRKMAAAYRNALAEFHPAFANAMLISTGAVVGVRESRRIIGDYTLSLEDYIERRSFADEICRNSYFIDIHFSKEESNKKGFDIGSRFQHYGKGETHGVPYRCLTPKDLKNVLVAGRSISCERVVQGSVRVMPVCLAMGEAAGMAAAHATCQKEPNVHHVDVLHLRERLREEDVYLPELSTDAAVTNDACILS